VAKSFRPKLSALINSGNTSVTAERSYPCCVAVRGIEFHDGGVHRKVRTHSGRIVVDEEFRGE
jgi:hypothetical protein